MSPIFQETSKRVHLKSYNLTPRGPQVDDYRAFAVNHPLGVLILQNPAITRPHDRVILTGLYRTDGSIDVHTLAEQAQVPVEKLGSLREAAYRRLIRSLRKTVPAWDSFAPRRFPHR